VYASEQTSRGAADRLAECRSRNSAARRANDEELTMKHAIVTTCMVIGTALAPVAALADGDTDRANPATFVKDSVITTKIKTKLAAEHLGSAAHIKVDTDNNGVVWMSGTANSQEEVNQAMTIARNTEGVKMVKSDLKVQKDR
jgi:hyperosmotically inducible protein